MVRSCNLEKTLKHLLLAALADYPLDAACGLDVAIRRHCPKRLSYTNAMWSLCPTRRTPPSTVTRRRASTRRWRATRMCPRHSNRQNISRSSRMQTTVSANRTQVIPARRRKQHRKLLRNRRHRLDPRQLCPMREPYAAAILYPYRHSRLMAPSIWSNLVTHSP